MVAHSSRQELSRKHSDDGEDLTHYTVCIWITAMWCLWGKTHTLVAMLKSHMDHHMKFFAVSITHRKWLLIFLVRPYFEESPRFNCSPRDLFIAAISHTFLLQLKKWELFCLLKRLYVFLFRFFSVFTVIENGTEHYHQPERKPDSLRVRHSFIFTHLILEHVCEEHCCVLVNATKSTLDW